MIALLLVISSAFADPGDYVLRAAYEQSGTSNYVDNWLKTLQNEYVSKELEVPAAAFGFLLQCGIKQRIELRWAF